MAHHTEISHINAENSIVGVFNWNTDANFSLDKLPYAPRAAFNSGPSTEDEPGWRKVTRSEIIQRIHEWIASDSGHILWLNGWAGCGKSTIASMISERCSDEGTAWFASFFFPKDRDTTTGTNFVGTIVQQLAQQRPILKESLKVASREFRKALKNVLDGYGQIIEKEIVYQWDTLLVRPVSGLKCAEDSTRLVIVIDALDECLKEADINNIIHLLRNLHVMGQIRPKVLVTSRPESNIKKRFLEIRLDTHRSIVLHNEPPERIERDIQRFISRRLNSLKLTDSELRLLTERASGLFIWISIACRQILLRKTTDLQRGMLERLLRLENQTDSEMHMNRLYATILANSVENGEDNYSQHDSTKFWSLVALRSPLSVDSLETLLQLRTGTVQDAFKPLHSIVEMPSKPSLLIRLHHPSFDNYLFDEKRCGDERFFVQSQRAHSLLADSCFVAMNMHLREDICDKRRPGTSTKEIDSAYLQEQIPPFLQYSCISWTQHTSASQYQMLDGGTVHEFLKRHFLHWFEALSWMGEVLEGIKMLTHLESYIPAQQSPELHAFVCDAKRFAIYGRTIAEESPLQIYSSLLLFTPSHGPIHQTFQCNSPWLKQSGKCKIKPTPLLHSLERATAGWIADVALSNKDTLATLTQEGSIEIWDLNIGAVTQIISGDPIKGHERKKAHPWDRNLRWIRFSPDGTKLAIVRNGSISVWDLNTNTRKLGSGDKTV
ncbi:hypothetical protein BS50DRAFT_592729 [Corynespora cassiicola Philippines]|uniref:Nephrocystin 3-like N-terminal domain-containing protein n=1 Tax=Corynespora cassiicola Philippines TaxID=1448308 RepID=A0A2T2N8L5_CORCC|nr:hypothetical protein BS50DRAFT_592729 [Corynespora cassiicola Philippines]